LNFGAFGTFSPLNIRSAPTFFPLLGQPYLGPNKLLNTLQEIMLVENTANNKRIDIFLTAFIGLGNKRFKPTNIIRHLQ
jgi:hypothetical protein